jgi:hypothetical protein
MSMAAQWMEQTLTMVLSSCSIITQECSNFDLYIPQYEQDRSSAAANPERPMIKTHRQNVEKNFLIGTVPSFPDWEFFGGHLKNYHYFFVNSICQLHEYNILMGLPSISRVCPRLEGKSRPEPARISVAGME